MENFKHICGKCERGFETVEEYCEHLCPVTDFKPTEIENLGEEFLEISKSALERGAERAEA